MMAFTHTHEDLKGNVTSSVQCIVYDDSGIHEVMQQFRGFLLAVSFQPATIDKYIEAE